MSEVRRDNKGRKLFNGESQRKDGKYEYKYHGCMGQEKERCTVGNSHRLIEFRQENVMIFPCEKRLSRFKRT